MRKAVYDQPDFAKEKSHLENVYSARGFGVLFSPKFHCEFSFIEQVWGDSKRFYRELPRSESVPRLEQNICKSLDQVDILQMRR